MKDWEGGERGRESRERKERGWLEGGYRKGVGSGEVEEDKATRV